MNKLQFQQMQRKKLATYNKIELENGRIRLFYLPRAKALYFTIDGSQLQYLTTSPEVAEQMLKNPFKIIEEKRQRQNKKFLTIADNET